MTELDRAASFYQEVLGFEPDATDAAGLADADRHWLRVAPDAADRVCLIVDDTGDAATDDTSDAATDDTGDAATDDTGDAATDDTSDAGTPPDSNARPPGPRFALVAGADVRERVTTRLRDRGVAVTTDSDELRFTDPDGNPLVVTPADGHDDDTRSVTPRDHAPSVTPRDDTRSVTPRDGTRSVTARGDARDAAVHGESGFRAAGAPASATGGDPLRVALGTENGLRVGRVDADGFRTDAWALPGETVRGLAVDPAVPSVFVACGLRGWGLFRVDLDAPPVRPGGPTPAVSLGFDDRWVWGVARDDRGRLYAGTEPAGLFRSTDGGDSWTELPVTDVPGREDWTFYHEPFGDGHVHGLAVDPRRPDRVVAGVEDGPTLASADDGAAWTRLLTDHDTHRVTVAPDDPDRLFVATADGLFERRGGGVGDGGVGDGGVGGGGGVGADAGENEGGDSDALAAGDDWHRHLGGAYVHDVRFHPADPERAWAYAATDHPVWRSDDGGRSWQPVGDDLPAARAAAPLALDPDDPDTLVYAAGETVGRLLRSTDAGASWRVVARELPKVWRVCVVG